MGRPKRDISTIIHILNDLLCASPQYRAEETAGAATQKPATGATAGPATETVQPPGKTRREALERVGETQTQAQTCVEEFHMGRLLHPLVMSGRETVGGILATGELRILHAFGGSYHLSGKKGLCEHSSSAERFQ